METAEVVRVTTEGDAVVEQVARGWVNGCGTVGGALGDA